MDWKAGQYNSSSLNLAGIIKAEIFWTTDYNQEPRQSGYKWRVNGLESKALYQNMDEAKTACEQFTARRLNMALDQMKG